MERKLFVFNNVLLVILAFLFITSTTGWANTPNTPLTDSWIFRSEVAPGQKVWQLSPGWNGNFNWDPLTVKSGWLKGTGLSASGTFDFGSISGNIEGNITTKYPRVASPGLTPITFNYSSIKDDSLISTGIGGVFNASAGVKVDFPWYIDMIPLINDVDFGISASASPYVKNDLAFTSNLGSHFFNSAQTTIVSLGADVVIAGVKMDVNAELDAFFTPNEITGIMKATHLESGYTLPNIPINFNSNNLELTKDVNLTPGHWEFSLEDFTLSDNLYSPDLSLEAEYIVNLALFGDVLSAEVPFIPDPFPDFKPVALDFLTHGYDGDTATADRLGRFYIHVVPIPGAVWLLGGGLIGLLGLRRKFRN